jgi:hypothetical protein
LVDGKHVDVRISDDLNLDEVFSSELAIPAPQSRTIPSAAAISAIMRNAVGL